MHTFKVVKQPVGWAIRLGDGMSTSFWSRDLAVQEANCLCEALRRHGQLAEVEVEPCDAPRPGAPIRRLFALLHP